MITYDLHELNDDQLSETELAARMYCRWVNSTVTNTSLHRSTNSDYLLSMEIIANYSYEMRKGVGLNASNALAWMEAVVKEKKRRVAAELMAAKGEAR